MTRNSLWFAAAATAAAVIAHGDPASMQGRTTGSLQRPAAQATAPQPAVRPIELPQFEARIAVGRYMSLPRPVHIAPRTVKTENPVIRPLLSMYQLDQQFADLFSPKGESAICGASSVANGLIYLRFNRRPDFPKIMSKSVPAGSANAEAVRAAFTACKVNKSTGTTSRNLVDCARDFVAEGGYATSWIWMVGIHGTEMSRKRAPQPEELREWIDVDRAIVLLFGWYTMPWDESLKKWVLKRDGGHFVALAGYDAFDVRRQYVSNPLVNYNAPGFGDARASALRLIAVPEGSIVTPGNVRGLWYTRDLVGGALAVLEDAIVIGAR